MRTMPARRRALAVLAVALVPVACAAPGAPRDAVSLVASEVPAVDASGEAAVPAEGGWSPLPESPLGARQHAHASWADGSVVVVGGSDASPCPPGADCGGGAPLADGAAFDPVTGAWRRIADAPVPLGAGAGAVSGATVGDTVHLWARGVPGQPEAGVDAVPATFLAYAVGADRWEELPPPPSSHPEALALVAAGDRVVAYHSTQEAGVHADLVYDSAARSWAELPPDPLAPSFDRVMVHTDVGLVLLGAELVPQPGSEHPAFVRAVVLDPATGVWRRLPDSEVLSYGPPWFWAGGRLVNPVLGGADGGEVDNYGQAYPFGGVLDPATGAWSALPDPPTAPAPGPFTALSAGGSDTVLTLGWALHLPTGTWSSLDAPAGLPDASTAATVWAGDRLFVWGGARWDGDTGEVLDGGWTWLPPAR